MRFGIVALAAAALLLVGCASQPDATPTPSATALPFATDEEAFAAAEATYRAYVDAQNGVVVSDPETFTNVYEWSTGEANAGARTYLTELHSLGHEVTGETRVLSIGGQAERLLVCVDVGTVKLVDASGSVIPNSDRTSIQSFVVILEERPSTATGLAVSKFLPGDPALC
ncbi:hypothetical protein AB2L57_11570 [Microbacterium sp. HA-8]|uniref:hypothetical protein n=1 Tax=Microbacterium sp. HA-8 TaxID=3234200 RepID=UPI0038F693E7